MITCLINVLYSLRRICFRLCPQSIAAYVTLGRGLPRGGSVREKGTGLFGKPHHTLSIKHLLQSILITHSYTGYVFKNKTKLKEVYGTYYNVAKRHLETCLFRIDCTNFTTGKNSGTLRNYIMLQSFTFFKTNFLYWVTTRAQFYCGNNLLPVCAVRTLVPVTSAIKVQRSQGMVVLKSCTSSATSENDLFLELHWTGMIKRSNRG